ncbi:VOC family protein [bacterium]|nr:VOC family protein [bacterium]
MKSALSPYISFKDNAREAMTFYQTVFGGKLDAMTFKDFNVSEDPAEADKIMHSMLQAENGITFMGSDTPNSMEYKPGARISMALSGDDHDELKGYFEKLSAGGTINQPLVQAPWGDSFGSCTDKFGVDWLVNIAGKKA